MSKSLKVTEKRYRLLILKTEVNYRISQQNDLNLLIRVSTIEQQKYKGHENVILSFKSGIW